MRKITFSLLMLLMASTAASTQMKPGLWEMTTKSDAIRNMPKISPEQMEQMRQMGINVPQVKNGAMVNKVCISKEMAAREQLPQELGNEAGCQTKNVQRSGNGYSLDLVCDGPAIKGQGRARGSYVGGESFTSTYDFKGAMNGQPVTQHMESSGKWLSVDCGSVKPIDAIAK